MSVFQAAPGAALGLGAGQVLLAAPLDSATAPPPPPVTSAPPGSIAGLSGWWDAGDPTNMVNAAGVPLASLSGGSVAALTDLSGSSRAMVPSLPVQAAPRINGLLGGAGLPTPIPAGAGLAPLLDPRVGFVVNGLSMGSGSSWTRYLVWTRPNLRSGTSYDADPVALLTIGSTVVLALDSVAAGRLVLFPGASQTVLSVTMERRHTHNVILRYTAGTGVDAWLDGVKVASAVANPLPSNNPGTLTFLSDTTSQGSAQCWFNEAATWERALSSAEVTTLITASARWLCGARRGVNLLVIGQSNAVNSLADGAWNLCAQGLAWHLGAASYGVIGGQGSAAYTAIGGHGIYNVRQPPGTGGIYIPGAFLADPGDGSNPGGWGLGPDGVAVEAYLAEWSAADLADIAAIVWPWFESDSTRIYGEGAFWQAGAQNFLALVRGMLGRSAASLPLAWWDPIAFWSSPGVLMIRNAMPAMSALPAQNAVCAMPLTADSNPRGATWDANTGLVTGGDYNHLDATDNLRLGQVAAGPIARAVLASSGGDSISAIPPGVPSIGPAITHAYRRSDTVIVVTVAHDAGSDLIVPLQAVNGTGWAVMDGGSEAVPGTVRTATACARVDATHLQVTLGSALTSASSGCLLFYPYGNTWIYRGNAVTDNSASVERPAGWDIGADLGSGWDWNLPVQATNTPIQLSDSPT